MTEDHTNEHIVQARLQEMILRFGKHLDAEQRTQVQRRIERSVRLANDIRATPLSNADEPEIVFMPYRGEA